MGNTMRSALTEEDDNLRRFYLALVKDDDDAPDIFDYGPFGDYYSSKVALEMASERIERGVVGLKTYVASLGEEKDPAYKRLIKILSDSPPEIECYAGTLLSDVNPQKVPWLWYPRLALGKIAMLDGDPGLGKSLIGADIGARITTGENMLDGRACHVRGGVVVIMPEDTLEDIIQPRFARAGADLSKVVDLSTIKTDDSEESRRPFQLQSDLDCLEAAIRRVDAKLVYIDPITALMGGTNMNQDDDVRRTLSPLKILIEKLQVACIMVRHMTKTRGDNPLMAGQGSIAFISLARTGLMVTKNPQDKSQVILSHIKSNIGPLAPGITYTICNDEVSGDERPYLVFTASYDGSENESKLSTPELITAPRKRTRK